MNDKTLHNKNELLNWLLSLEDEEIILKLLKFKTETEYVFKISEQQPEYAVKDDFDERFAKGLTSEEARRESKRLVREWWGK